MPASAEPVAKQEYVLGFAFDTALKRVPLIQKTKPAWQAGKLNGIGGKLHWREVPMAGMAREFYEETGFPGPLMWRHFATLTGSDWQVYCFTVVSDEALNSVTTTEGELVVMADTQRLPEQVISNLRWLIPLAMHPSDIASPVVALYP